MEAWSAWKDFCDAASEAVLRETVMSTIEPEEIDGGSRIDGNSIWTSLASYLPATDGGPLNDRWDSVRTYQSFVFCKQNSHACIDFAHGQRYEHLVMGEI